MNDNNQKLVLILERSSHNLDVNQDGGDIVLEGVFAQFGVVNNNDRLYEEAEYLPHLEYLQKKIKENRLLGELDHPEKFDISLSKTSHLIEKLDYNKISRQITGRVRLLDTPSGRIAKDLVKAGVPISISSRAAGMVEPSKKVKIKKIFTYDLVADPGFENAVLSRMNESLGISSDLIAVYDMTEKYPELLAENAESPAASTSSTKTTQSVMEFVTTDEMNAYSLFVKEEFEKLQEKMNSLNEKNENSEVTLQINEMNSNVSKIQEYLDYLANTSEKSIKYTEYVAEKLDKVIEYTNYVAKTLDESIEYTETIAEKTEQGIEYTQHVAEKADQGIQYTEYMKESVEKIIGYTDYLKECLEKTVDYTEHIAEKADQGIQYGEYLAEKAEQGIQYTEVLAEKLNQAISYADYLGEGLNKGVAYTEYVAEQSQAIADYAEYAVLEGKKSGSGTSISEGKETSTLDYKTLPSKVDELIASISKKKINESEERHFTVTMLLNEARRSEFRSMDEATKQKVISALNNDAVKTEEDANRVWESILTPTVERWVEEAPNEYKQIWESLDGKAKDTLIKQSRTYKLETPYQIRNFWETRPASILGRVSSEQKINEGKEIEISQPVANPLGYSSEYLKQVEAALGKFPRK